MTSNIPTPIEHWTDKQLADAVRGFLWTLGYKVQQEPEPKKVNLAEFLHRKGWQDVRLVKVIVEFQQAVALEYTRERDVLPPRYHEWVEGPGDRELIERVYLTRMGEIEERVFGAVAP